MLRYFRRVNTLAPWEEGKNEQAVLSKFEEKYITDLKKGVGFPSVWMAENNEDLEKIALGIILRGGSLDSVHLVGFNENCFNEFGIQLINKKDEAFPVLSVSHLHYEAVTSTDEELTLVIEKFIQCHGGCKQYAKANEKTTNMRQIAAKYLSEVSESYREKARVWGEKYIKSIEII